MSDTLDFDSHTVVCGTCATEIEVHDLSASAIVCDRCGIAFLVGVVDDRPTALEA